MICNLINSPLNLGYKFSVIYTVRFINEKTQLLSVHASACGQNFRTRIWFLKFLTPLTGFITNVIFSRVSVQIYFCFWILNF